MTNENKINALIASVLQIEEEKVNDSLSSESINNWDSLRHLSLIVSIEEAFDIRFNDEEIIELSSYLLIKESLKEKGISF